MAATLRTCVIIPLLCVTGSADEIDRSLYEIDASRRRGHPPPAFRGEGDPPLKVCISMLCQGRVAEEVLGLMNSSQAKLDPSSRFSPTATQPSALKGPKRVPHNARITPMP